MIGAYKKHLFLLSGILLLSFALKYHYVETYSTYTDEILSAVVAKSIFENGLPVLPSGYIYPRAPLHHYFLSIPVGLFGLDYLPMRINAIVFSLIVIGLIYLLGAKIAGPNVGLAAVVFLSFNSIFNQYSFTARMYMTYALLYVGAFYFFYEGFVQNKTRWKKFALICMAGAMLSSEAGIVIGPIFFVLLCIYQKIAWIKDRMVWISGLIWVGLFLATVVLKIPKSFTPFTVDSGLALALFVDITEPIAQLVIHLTYSVRNLDVAIPFSMPFFFLMTAWVVKKKVFKKHFALVVFLPALLLQSFYSFKIQNRVAVTLVPFYILACCHFMATLWCWAHDAVKEKGSVLGALSYHAGKVAISVFIFVCLSGGFFYEKQLRQKSGVKTYGYNPFYDSYADVDPRPAYLYLNANVQSGDIVVQTTAEYGLFFLTHDVQYYYLRQKAFREKSKKIKFTSFTQSHEPYYAHPFIDSIPKFEKLLEETGSPVWVVLGPKTVWALSSELRGYVEKKFSLMTQENKTKIFRYSPQT
jgi:hypothetical protein